MSEYTPSMDEVRTAYKAGGGYRWPERGEQFDRWITENNQKVRAHTLNEAADILHEEVLYQAILGNGDNDETL